MQGGSEGSAGKVTHGKYAGWAFGDLLAADPKYCSYVMVSGSSAFDGFRRWVLQRLTASEPPPTYAELAERNPLCRELFSECRGDGRCLVRTKDRTHEPPYVCPFGCRPRPCANTPMCGEMAAQWILECSGGVCLDCAVAALR